MQEREISRKRFSRMQGIILTLILLATVVCWVYMSRMGGDSMDGMVMDMGSLDPEMQDAMDQRALSGLTTVALPSFTMFFPMWAVMCVAMMLPTAIPMILCMTRISEQRMEQEGRTRASIYQRPILFSIGYCIMWCAFGAVMWGVAFVVFKMIGVWLNTSGANLWLAVSVLFILTGIYQVSPLKYACLYGCQHPLMFLMKHWNPTSIGAVWMGVRHSFECIGCCVALMVVMLPLGMMNLVWMAIFTLIMYFEKDAKFGSLLSKIVGWLFTVAGAISLVIALVMRFI